MQFDLTQFSTGFILFFLIAGIVGWWSERMLAREREKPPEARYTRGALSYRFGGLGIAVAAALAAWIPRFEQVIPFWTVQVAVAVAGLIGYLCGQGPLNPFRR